MYQTNYNQQGQQASEQRHLHLDEQDVAKLVLSELKRTAREYTTAALEATHPAIRQTFISLTQKTLQDQAELFTVLSQINGYGNIRLASQQEVQQELQNQIHKAEQLQSTVQGAVQNAYASSAGLYQQQGVQGQQQTQAYQQQNLAFQQQPSPQAYQTSYNVGGANFTSPSSQGGQTSYGTGSQNTSYGQSAPSQSPGQGFSSSYSQPLLQGQGYSAGYNTYGSSQQDNDFSQKSSVAGTDAGEYYTAKQAVQEYNSGRYGSSATESYGSSSQAGEQSQGYASSGIASSAGRQIGGYSMSAASSSEGSGSAGKQGSSSSASATRQSQSGSQGSHQGTKYMM
ncbi:spore coat protein [Paenibacillus sp. S-38]|uniref:spore coat protein n=1 Tax=Paenibacillus sp. S-38 TaxID=3416710 RepID=UPI003CF28458